MEESINKMKTFAISSKIVFVILHYMNKSDTVECIESINNNIRYENKAIVVVDNASPNGSGFELQNDYAESRNVYVLLNQQNMGFAKGNNVGYIFAKNKLMANYIVCINNDTIITQNDFCSKINQLYDDYHFDILGPDIVTKDGYHQNPVNKSLLNSRKIMFTKLKKNVRKVLNEFGIDIYIEKFRSSNRKIYLSEKVVGEKFNCGLHGSCVVFSKGFINRSDYAFYEDTFMYFEEDIMFLQAYFLNYLTCYSDKLCIYHKEYGATQTVYMNYRNRKRNYYTNIIRSINVYKRLLKEYNKN